jgi:hypothetical protein
MTLNDLLLFWTGDAGAILRLAADPWTLGVGALLVLSAGLARNYDTRDLSRQWPRLLVPFLASTLAAAALFLVIALTTQHDTATLAFGRGLLGLFWLTSPLAWLYGFPFERLWSASRAAGARRAALAVVATGRVVLMARCASVLLGYGWWESLLIITAFAVPAAVLAIAAALFFVRQPEEVESRQSPPTAATRVVGAANEVIDHMGVLPEVLPPAGSPNVEWSLDSQFAGGVGVVAVVLMVVGGLLLQRLIGPSPRWVPLPDASGDAPEIIVWAVAAGAILFWIPWLILRQPAQRLRTRFVKRLRTDDLRQTLQDLAARRPEDFPPHWRPAATLARRGLASRMLQAAQAASHLPAGCRVRSDFLSRFGQMLPVWLDPIRMWYQADHGMSEEELKALASVTDVLRQAPEGAELLSPYQDYLFDLNVHAEGRDPPRSELLQALLAVTLKRGSRR